MDASISNTKPSTPVLPIKIGKFKASYLLVQQSFSILMKDKEILAFPVLTTICTAIVTTFAAGLFVFVFLQSNISSEAINTANQSTRYAGYAVLFINYLIAAFILTYFQAGLTAIVHGRMQGKNLSFSDGIRTANAHIGKIFVWALISATIGLILHIVAERSKIIGKIVAGLLGATWSIITLFIVPTLILEEGTVQDAIRKSAETFKRAWGETLIANFSIGLFMGLLSFAGIVVTMSLIFTRNIPVMIVGFLVLILFLIGVTIVSASLQAILRVALYIYASTGTVPEGFAPELITGAMRRKS